MKKNTFIFCMLFLMPFICISENIKIESKKLVLKLDTSEAKAVKRDKLFIPANGTHWNIKDGIMIGLPSTSEERAKAKEKKLKYAASPVPRMKFIKTGDAPKDVLIDCSFMIKGGKSTGLVPMIESGHHKRRIYFSKNGIQLMVYGAENKVLDQSDTVIERGKWYDVKIVILGKRFEFYLNGQKHLSAEHEKVIIEPGNGNAQIAFAGPAEGEVHIRKLEIYSLK